MQALYRDIPEGCELHSETGKGGVPVLDDRDPMLWERAGDAIDQAATFFAEGLGVSAESLRQSHLNDVYFQLLQRRETLQRGEPVRIELGKRMGLTVRLVPT